MIFSSSPAKLIVFDLDGTLAETAGDLIASLNHVLMLEGAKQVELSAARKMVGTGARNLIRLGLVASGRSVSPERLEVLFSDFVRYYEAHIADHSHLFPGVVAALNWLEADGYTFAVCTNKIESASLLLLKKLGVLERFRFICGQDTFGIAKPHAEVLLKTIARAGSVPEHTIMVGDSITDIQTARNAGVPVVAVDFGYTDVPVSELGPDRVISHFDELRGALAGLTQARTALDLAASKPLKAAGQGA